MKQALIAAILLTSVAYSAPRSDGQQQAAHAQTEARHQASPSSSQVHPNAEAASSQNGTTRLTDWLIVIIAFLTACVVAWQSWETRRAAEATQASVRATERTVALMRDKERARVRIDTVEFRLVRGEVRKKGPPRPSDQIEFKTFCYGATDAFILESYYQLWITDGSQTEPGPLIPFGLPKAMRASDGGIERSEPIDWLIDNMTADTVRGLKNTFVLCFRVFVKYKDVFQNKTHWEMQSTYTWNFICLRDADNTFSWDLPPQNSDTEAEKSD